MDKTEELTKAKKVNKKANNEELEKEKTLNKELNDKVLRLVAEMQNMSKRYDAEKQNIFKYDGENLIKELLPIIDNFERAISLDTNNLSDELNKFLSGFKMIYTSLLSTLTKMGVEEIDALGKEFDPTTMEAIMTTNIMEEDQNIVVDVLQKGYKYKDKVIRVAMVKVNQ